MNHFISNHGFPDPGFSAGDLNARLVVEMEKESFVANQNGF